MINNSKNSNQLSINISELEIVLHPPNNQPPNTQITKKYLKISHP